MGKCAGIRWLSAANLVETNSRVILEFTPSEPIGVLKHNELESTQQAPAMYSYYEQTEDIFLLASVLFHKLTTNHIFRNGNKRTAFHATAQFLAINGFSLAAEWQEVLDLCVLIVEGAVDKEQLATWLEMNSSRIDEIPSL